MAAFKTVAALTLCLGSVYAQCNSNNNVFNCPSVPQPTLPSASDWYKPPANADWKNSKNGAVLKVIQDQNTYCQFNNKGVHINNAYFILYKTTNSLGQPALAATTLLEPPCVGSTQLPSKLFVYQPAYDSASIDCSPTYQFGLTKSNNPSETDIIIAFEQLILNSSLSQGFYTAYTDYETTLAEFTNGQTSGQALLDGVRAILASGSFKNAVYNGKSSSTGISSAASVALVGYSGGSIATEWAAELQPTYASELGSQIKAFAAGGVVANLNESIHASGVDGSGMNAALIPRGLVGEANGDSSFGSYLNSSLASSDATNQFYSTRSCTVPPQTDFSNKKILSSTYFKNVVAFFSKGTPFERMLNKVGIMGKNYGTPPQQLYFFQGCNDEIAPQSLVAQLVGKYCGSGNNGASLTYVTYPNQNHAGGATSGVNGAFNFVVDRLTRTTPPPTGCDLSGSTGNSQC